MKVRRSPHAVYNIEYHFVWIPKYRKSIMVRNVKAYAEYLIRKVCKEYGLWIIELEVASDHVHLFVESPPKYSPAEIMNFLKSITAREIFKKFAILREHFWAGEFWGDGYYVGTSGDQVTTDSVKEYIRRHRSEDDY